MINRKNKKLRQNTQREQEFAYIRHVTVEFYMLPSKVQVCRILWHLAMRLQTATNLTPLISPAHKVAIKNIKGSLQSFVCLFCATEETRQCKHGGASKQLLLIRFKRHLTAKHSDFRFSLYRILYSTSTRKSHMLDL